MSSLGSQWEGSILFAGVYVHIVGRGGIPLAGGLKAAPPGD